MKNLTNEELIATFGTRYFDVREAFDSADAIFQHGSKDEWASVILRLIHAVVKAHAVPQPEQRK